MWFLGAMVLTSWQPGDVVQYFCKQRKTWLTCKVTALRPEGMLLNIRGTILPSREVVDRIRAAPTLPTLAEPDCPASESAEGSGESGGVGKDRARGIHDPAWEKFATHWVRQMGSVRAIFRKFTESFKEARELATLKEQLLTAFPKLPRNNYAPFHAAPGSLVKIEGKIHPSPWQQDCFRDHQRFWEGFWGRFIMGLGALRGKSIAIGRIRWY